MSNSANEPGSVRPANNPIRAFRSPTLLPLDHSRGASMIEYALLAALIAVVCVVALTFLGGTASQTFSNVGSGFQGNN